MVNKIRKSIILMAIIYTALGIALIINPSTSLDYVCISLGVVSLFYGIANIFTGIKEKKVDGTVTEIIIGSILSLLGIILIFSPRFFTTLIILFFGLFLIIEGMNSIKKAFALKEMNYRRWWGTLISALAITLLGILVVINPFTTADIVIIFIGVSFVFNGINTIIVAYLITKATKDFPEVDQDTL